MTSSDQAVITPFYHLHTAFCQPVAVIKHYPFAPPCTLKGIILHPHLFMYKLLNSTFMSLLELMLLESGNSRADFIVLATNIEMFLSCWILYFFFPCCKNQHPDIAIKDTTKHNCVLCIKDRVMKCRTSISLTVPAHLLVAKLQNTFKFWGF